MTLLEFNDLNHEQALRHLLQVCHCQHWAQSVTEQRPFESLKALQDTCDAIWSEASELEILEAFAGHPRIGDMNALRDKYSRASHEQGQVVEASDQVLADLVRLNSVYEERNQFIFIVCATGKSASQMRDLMLERIDNNRDTELRIGSEEQAKITRLRLRTMIDGHEEDTP